MWLWKNVLLRNKNIIKITISPILEKLFYYWSSYVSSFPHNLVKTTFLQPNTASIFVQKN
ncbi:unnamed protein product [Brugia timori]|uniref:Uncharacterized protein n=1 Tax=Brugia timori TaxID=42155 RepID=A0A0R3Q862_9BILA|nr:unnamed protein product [Brugia timori]